MQPQGKFRFHFLLHASHLLEERLRARLAPHDIQPRQARVLDALKRMGSASQVKLAKEFGLTAASMSTMTSRLLKADLIDKRTDPEAPRNNVLSLSKRGQKLLERIYREWRAVDREIGDALGPENADQLAALALELRDSLGGSTPGGTTAASDR